MKIKNFILYILFVSSIYSFSQNNTCGKITYTTSLNLAYPYQEHFEMTFNDKMSYSEEINITKTKSTKTQEFEDRGMTNKVIMARKDEPSFYYNSNNGFYYSKVWEKDTYIIKEDNLVWNWELHPDTKEISGFQTQKATITFRGRNYTAWFTPEIPVKFGPWKFQGLPGLILEVYDDSERVDIRVNNVVINDKENCAINFDESLLQNYLSVSDYLEVEKENIREKIRIMNSKLPKGRKPLSLDEDCNNCNDERLEIFD